MKSKLANSCFLAVVVLGFSLYVSGLSSSAADPTSMVQAEQPAEGDQGGSDYTVLAEGGESDDGEVITSATAGPTPTRTPTPINVGNFVWNDLDDDGRQDAGEPGLEGVTVQLWNAAKTSLIDQDETNANGNYSVIAPTPGQYRVRVVLPSAADTFSPKDQAGGNDQLDSDVNPSGANLGFTDIYTFASNLISITTIDAGIQKFATPTPTRTPTPINVGNLVWDDADGDGRKDASESGVAGVTVQLWNATKTSLIDETTTSSTGSYTVVAPTPGQYRVRVVLPSAADAFSPKDQAGGDDQLDSDINPSGPHFGFTDTYTFASNLISISTIDAGLILAATPTPTPTPTPDPSATPTPTPSETPTPSPTATAEPTLTPTPTATPGGSTTTTEGGGSTTTTDGGGSTTTTDGSGNLGEGIDRGGPASTGGGSVDDGTLPRTGSAQAGRMIIVATLLFAMGAVLVLVGRRVRARA